MIGEEIQMKTSRFSEAQIMAVLFSPPVAVLVPLVP